MMKCELIQNRLLGLTDITVVPDDISSHLTSCELCCRFVDRVVLLNDELAVLPAASSEDAKAVFLDTIRGMGPIIKSVPATTMPGITLRQLLAKIPLRPLLATAAAIAIGVGIWANWSKPQLIVAAKPESPRHQLLAKMPSYVKDLATMTPKDRLARLTHLAHDLRAETEALAKVAQPDEMTSLARMYENVVNNAILKNADEMTQFNTTAMDRKAALSIAATELGDTAAEFSKLAPTASQQLQPILLRIEQTARDGELRLKKKMAGEAS